jgi:hypothetical protein
MYDSVSLGNLRSPRLWTSVGSRVSKIMQMHLPILIWMVLPLRNASRHLWDKMFTWKNPLLLSKEGVRRYPKVLRRVSRISIKRGFAECKPILYFWVEGHFNRSKIDYI